MSEKISNYVGCPHCGNKSTYVYYIGTEDLWCHSCGLSFAIEDKIVVTTTSKKKYFKCPCGKEREYLDCFKMLPDESGHYTGDCETIQYTKASECDCGIELNCKADFEECYIYEYNIYSK